MPVLTSLLAFIGFCPFTGLGESASPFLIFSQKDEFTAYGTKPTFFD